MIPYFFLLITAVVLAVASATIFRWKSKNPFYNFLDPFYVALVLLLVLFAGTREGIGADYYVYQSIFNRLETEDWISSIVDSPHEEGFTVLSLIIKTLNENPYFFFLLISFLTVILVILSIHLAGANLVLGILVYILFAHYLSPMNIARQGLATATLLLAVILFEHSQRGRWAAGVLFALAASIHASVLFLVPLFLLLRFVYLRGRSVILLSLVMALGGAAIARTPVVLNLLNSLNERYTNYLEFEQTSGFGALLAAIMHIGIGIYFLKSNSWTPAYRWYLNIYLLTGPFYLLGTGVSFATRLGDFTSIFLIVLLPQFFKDVPKSKNGIWIILCFGIGYYLFYLLNWGGLLPYQSWL